MNLTSGVNLTNILRAPFLHLSVLHSFSLITVWLCNFFSTKAAFKMFVKFPTEVVEEDKNETDEKLILAPKAEHEETDKL